MKSLANWGFFFSMDIHIADTRQEMGRQAAADIAAELRRRLSRQQHLRMIFAAAPSQREMLDALAVEQRIDWTRITAFHMDEYVGLPADAPQRFGLWLRGAIFERVPFASVHLIETSGDPEKACIRYAKLLAEGPVDLVLLGIGVNGHLAFNDPPADLHDRMAVKVVALDEVCRRQQVDDGCFASVNEVPRNAITLTVPTLLRADKLFCCVPGESKQVAVRRMVHDPVSGACPATALRTHSDCTVYLDRSSSALL